MDYLTFVRGRFEMKLTRLFLLLAFGFLHRIRQETDAVSIPAENADKILRCPPPDETGWKIRYLYSCNSDKPKYPWFGEAYRDNLSNEHNRNITKLLDSLLRGYNKHLRPGYGDHPVVVETNILIRSMGPVSEERMMFSMDCYFRQKWHDRRLKFIPQGNTTTELRPSMKMLEEIWKPDTFFLNGQDSYLHTITYSNKLFRIDVHGSILYSQRLTIKTACKMYLQKYPLDTQTCPLAIGSYGYPRKDVQYQWEQLEDNKPVKPHQDIAMAQFTLTGITHGNKTMGKNHGMRSILYVEFKLRREIGYYLLQIYLPCYLIVIISWVSFWINREATPARVTLGITTLLTTCTIAITGRTGIPKVGYSTALDIFLLMCFSFVFAALVEYAGVNYFTKGGMAKEIPDESEEENEPTRPLLTTTTYSGQGIQHTLARDINGHTVVSVNHPVKKDSCWIMFMHCLRGNTKYKNFKNMSKTGSLSVSKIDSMAKIIFPFSFICLNILYWAGFLYYF